MSLVHPPTVSAWIHRLARECGEREMVVLGASRLTYAAAEAESGLLARGMLAAGIGKGTREGRPGTPGPGGPTRSP